MIESWRWHVFIANLDPAIGSEQAGTRPVLVVSEEDFNRIMPLVTVLPITSRKEGRRLHPDEVLLEAGAAGLHLESIILAHQIRTISKRRLGLFLAVLDNAGKQEQITDALSEHLGFW